MRRSKSKALVPWSAARVELPTPDDAVRASVEQVLDGCTSVSFGPFEALTGGRTLRATNDDPVWKVWHLSHRAMGALLVAGNLYRTDAVLLAKRLAEEWRARGKPAL